MSHRLESDILNLDTLGELRRHTSVRGFQRMLTVFEQETRNRMVRLLGAAGSEQEVFRDLHTLKSSAATFGGLAMAQCAARLESQAQGGTSPQPAEIEELAELADQTLSMLRTEREAD